MIFVSDVGIFLGGSTLTPISIKSPLVVRVESGALDWTSLSLSLLLVVATILLAIVTYRLVTGSRTESAKNIDALKSTNSETIEAMKSTNSETIEAMKFVNQVSIENLQAVNKDNQKLSILAMRHDSALKIYANALAGMRGSLDTTHWMIEQTNISPINSGLNPDLTPRAINALTKPKYGDYPEYADLDPILQKFRSMETKAMFDLLESEDVGMQIASWIDKYTVIMENWNVNIPTIRTVLNGGQVPISVSQGSLIELKRVTTVKLAELSLAIVEIKTLMESKLDGERA